MSPMAVEQRRRAASKITPAQTRRVLRLAGKKTPPGPWGRWKMPLKAIGVLVGLSGERVRQILAAHAQTGQDAA